MLGVPVILLDGSEIPKQPPGMYKTIEIVGYSLYYLVSRIFFHQQDDDDDDDDL